MRHIVLFIFGCLLTTYSWGQCDADRHTTNATDGWLSCQASPNPNTIHGNSHWIHLDLGGMKTLYDFHFWNINHPDYLDDGLKTLIIETSLNGTTWNAVDTLTLSRASGSGFYSGTRGPDLQGTTAAHVLITAIDNHGGGCYGLSELKIYTQDFDPGQMSFPLSICENDGVYTGLQGGLHLNGTYEGLAVVDNGDDSFDFDATYAGAGLHEITYAYAGGSQSAMLEVLPCSHTVCGGCIDCPGYDQVTIDGSPIPPGRYQDSEVHSMGTSAGAESVIFWGGQSVELRAGFEATGTGTFEVDIRTCYDNLLLNAGFEEGREPWQIRTYNGAVASYTLETTSPFSGAASGRVDVTAGGSSVGDVRLRYHDLTMEAGKRYRLSFHARAATNTSIELRFIGESDPYTSYLKRAVTLKPHWNKYSYEFDATETRIEDVRIDFRIGNQIIDFYVDQVTWTEVAN